ncbi:DUF1441 family protein [Cereibacter sphaeroides]|uniref:DUF1441 family protein n=1 Tax=Cereibacter sphaeroides TaxID=1063 RepID=UPI001F271925|nr:DUF1441 family protein [Cereibacter sphaeroides]MCE6951685.1 DUF1441 family protein [Cereibacter sphaeroides]
MAMTPKPGWSISALATEFGLDRRTVASRVAGIPSCAEVAGKPVWRLSDVAAALASPNLPRRSLPRPAAPVAVPAEFADIADCNPADQMAVIALREMVRTAPAPIAAFAVQAGVPVAEAVALHKLVAASLAVSAAMVAEGLGIPDTDMGNAPPLAPVWPVLAESIGEIFDPTEAQKAVERMHAALTGAA